MPDLLDAIKGRRSVRKYLPRKIPDKLVEEVLVAASWAPSAHDAQPWRFVVLADASVKRRLAEAMTEAWASDLAKDGLSVEAEKRRERAERFVNAPALILACATMDGLRKFPDEKRQKCERDLALQSLGAAMQNLLLVAHSAGLGACWYSAPGFCKEVVRELLAIPDAVEPEALVTLGYSAETPSAPKKKSFAEYCFLNRWGRRL